MQPAILAGGKSTRFGEEKALFMWRDRAFVDHILATLGQVFEPKEHWISVDHTSNRARLMDHLSVRDDLVYVEDGPGEIEGPLAGIEAVLSYGVRSGVPWIFAVACDMPAIRHGLLIELAALASGAEQVSAVIPRPLSDGFRVYQPLHAFYRPAPCLEALRAYAATGQRSLQGFVESIPDRRIVEIDELQRMDPLYQLAMTNVNRQDEVEKLELGGATFE